MLITQNTCPVPTSVFTIPLCIQENWHLLQLALCGSAKVTRHCTYYTLHDILQVQYRCARLSVVSCTVYIPIDVTSNDTAAEGAVRLVGGNTTLEGRVEVFLLGQWGTVCDYNWDFVDAIVVCRQLGYPRAVEAPRSAYFGAGSGPSWYSSVRCTGTEHNLTECSKNTYNFGSACSHSRDAGVVCSSECSCTVIVFIIVL